MSALADDATSTPVETFVRYSTTVASLPDAWSFVMGQVDKFPTPNISIEALISVDDESDAGFAVTVYGGTND